MKNFNFTLPRSVLKDEISMLAVGLAIRDKAAKLEIIGEGQQLSEFTRYDIASNLEDDALKGLFRVIVRVPEMGDFCSEEQRQIILLALHNLRTERPGWSDVISGIERNLGGPLDFPSGERETPK